MSYLEENGSVQIGDETEMAEVFNKNFTGLAERLSDQNVGQFDPTAFRAFVNKRKVSDSRK